MNSEKQSTNLQMTLREVNRVGEEQKNVPKLRFKGYEDAWEQRKLGDVADKVTVKNSNLQYIETFTNSAEVGIISQRDYFDHDIANLSNLDGYYIVQKEDFVYNPRISTSAAVGPINRNKLGRIGVMSPLYTVFRTHNVDTTYLEYFFKSQYWHSFMKFHGDSGARADRFSIKDAIFFEMPIPLPDIDEQQKIGDYLNSVDYLITLHQRKYDALKTMKKTLLSKMFPKDGEDVPEIRFKGFTDAWEQRKLGEEVQIIMGQSPKGENYTDNPEDYILVQGNADMKDGKVFPRVWTTQVTKQAYKGDIILSVRAPVGDIGKTDYDVVIGRGVAAVKGNEFFYQLLGKLKQDGYWTKSSTGSTFDSINSNEIKSAKVTIPDIKEQLFIGDYFQGIDNLITLHQRKLDELKNMKKTLLQQMFV